MGFIKQMKDMKKVVHEAPDMIDQAQAMGKQAQEMQAAQQAAAQAQMEQMQQQQAAASPAAGAASGPDFEPIAGVSIEQYAEVSKGLADYNYDQSKAVEIAASKGIAPSDWEQATEGWNARITANPAVAQRFNALYTGRA
jgi:hypothetical protein